MSKILNEIKSKENKEKAKILMRFFKAKKGEYGQGDKFLGLTVPESRKIAQKYSNLNFSEIEKIIKNKYHEIRLIALLILVHKYKQLSKNKYNLNEKKKIYDFYLKNTRYINNWDLVDLSAHYILGDYLYQRMIQERASPEIVLIKLAKSKNLWDRRIAIITTFAFIYKGKSDWTFKITKRLLNDEHDLIHKACGWMLREVGKRVSEAQLRAFLDVYSPKMPRTMLRYAIERLPEKIRQYYLHKS